MTDDPELFPPPPRKRGRPPGGAIVPGETPEERKKRKRREAQARFRGTEKFARAQLRRWKGIVAAFAAARNGGRVPVKISTKQRTDAERKRHNALEQDLYWRKKREREEIAARLADPPAQENLALDDLPPGFVPLPPAEQKRAAFAESRERLERQVEANRAAGRANAPGEFAWFTFEPVHWSPDLFGRCEKCGLRISTPLGERRCLSTEAGWLAHTEDNCHAMFDVPDEVFWPRKDEPS